MAATALETFRELPDAAAYCEDNAIPFDWIEQRGKRFAVVQPSSKARAKPLTKAKPKAKPKPRAKAKPKPRRERVNASPPTTCKAKTRNEKKTRPSEWKYFRDDLREIAGEEDEAQGAYRERLEKARKACKKTRAETTRDCAAKRKKARERYARARDDGRGKRQEDWASYRARTCAKGGTGRRYSAAESDSLAEHSIPEKLHKLWRNRARGYPVSMAPDARAEKFREDVEGYAARENLESNDLAELIELEQEDAPDYDAQYKKHAERERADLEDEIPF